MITIMPREVAENEHMSENESDMVPPRDVLAHLLAKVSHFRDLVNKMDWSDDAEYKNVNAPKAGYTYVSERKYKNNLKTALVECGLEMTIKFYDLKAGEPIGNMRTHYTVRAHMMLIDVDNGANIEYDAYGESADSGDKAVRKAQTSAFKSLFDSNFMLAESQATDDDREPSPASVRPPTEEQRKEILSSMEGNVVRTEPPAPSTVPVQTAIDAPDTPITDLQRRGIANLLSRFEKAVNEGKRTQTEFDACKDQADHIRGPKDAAEFLKHWKV